VNNRFEEKRGNGKYSSQLLLIATCVGCCDDPTVKSYLIKLQFILKIPQSYVFNMDGGIVHWKSVEASGIL